MPETKPVRNAMSNRYSTTRALGFRGGSTGADGNLIPATSAQVSGVNPPAPKTPAQPAIGNFGVDTPRPPSTAAGLASSVAGNLATKGLSNMAGKAWDSFNDTRSQNEFARLTSSNASSDSAAGGVPYGYGDYGSPAADLADPTAGIGDFSGAGDAFEGANYADLAMEGYGDYASVASDIFEGANYADLAMEGYGDYASGAGEAAGGSIPYLGAGIRAIQGDYGGAAGSAVGATIGSAFGPVGTVVGSWLGGTIGSDCFITEAVMSAGGQGDAAPELQILRQFRDQVMMATPVGQVMVQQYEAIAPMVVEAVTQRPDALQIFQSIKAQFIDPAVQAVQQGDNDQALQIYAKMIAFVTPLAIEAQIGPGGETDERPVPGQEGMDDLASQAALLEHSPEMAMAATQGGQGGMMGAGMMNDQMPQQPGGMMQPPMPQDPQQPAIGQSFARRRY